MFFLKLKSPIFVINRSLKYSKLLKENSHHYSFGSPMPGRHYTNANGYRYGFNGKENDNEVVSTGEGTQDYGLRIYNPALGKFLSVDPLSKDFPWNSTYAFAENSPILNVDLDGGEKNPYWVHLINSNGDAGQAIATYALDWFTEGLGLIVEGGQQVAGAEMQNTTESGYTEYVPEEQRASNQKVQQIEGNVKIIEGAADFAAKNDMGIAAAEGGVLIIAGASNLKAKTEAPPSSNKSQASANNGVKSNGVAKPTEAYNRRKHYGNTPTKSDRKAFGATSEQVVDHKRSLVEHYYEGDGSGGMPGYLMSAEQRKQWGKDRNNMQLQPKSESNVQGAQKANYSKQQKKANGLQ